jgi:hypothetical protein
MGKNIMISCRHYSARKSRTLSSKIVGAMVKQAQTLTLTSHALHIMINWFEVCTKYF